MAPLKLVWTWFQITCNVSLVLTQICSTQTVARQHTAKHSKTKQIISQGFIHPPWWAFDVEFLSSSCQQFQGLGGACKKSKNAISACMSTVMCCKWWTASPFFLQDWSVPVIAISWSLSSPCPDSYAWNKKVNTVRHIQRCSQNLSSLFNNTGVFEGHDANISLQSDILKTLPTKPTPGRHSANKKCNLHFGLVPPEQ